MLQRIARKAKRVIGNVVKRRKDALGPTHASAGDLLRGTLWRYLQALPAEVLASVPPSHLELCELYLNHRFDLLGSGWVCVRHGMRCSGLEGSRYEMGETVTPDQGGEWLKGRINSANFEESARIWGMIDNGYVPIDWHLDFKSGYRWREDKWYRDIHFGHMEGADVKVPWELARMQHLPQIAVAYAITRAGHDPSKDPFRYAREFRNEVLDFVATNPPMYGVNWSCTMDVAIRAVNWLIAYDLFRANGCSFDVEFERIFKRSIYGHAVHITNNLERSPDFRNNHYLADVAGLLFISAYLPSSREVDRWLAFAADQLIREVDNQFNADGTNVEASTCYHILSAQMVVYATALLMGIKSKKRDVLSGIAVNEGGDHGLPSWYIERVEKMGEFVLDITKPDGRLPQIGDNDSGRFLKILPSYNRINVKEAKLRYANLRGYAELSENVDYWDEDILDAKHLIAAINGFVRRDDFKAFSKNCEIETAIVEAMSRGRFLRSYRESGSTRQADAGSFSSGEWKSLDAVMGRADKVHRYEIPVLGSGLLDGLTMKDYPDFGLYVYRSRRLYMAVRCGPTEKLINAGHAHNDQLSIELNIDGRDFASDPGTYLYTPNPEMRNLYRSVRAHHGPQVREYLPDDQKGVFSLMGRAKAKCIHFGKDEFVAVIENEDSKIIRRISLCDRGILIEDLAESGRCGKDADIARDEKFFKTAKVPYSNGYGRIMNCEMEPGRG